MAEIQNNTSNERPTTSISSINSTINDLKKSMYKNSQKMKTAAEDYANNARKMYYESRKHNNNSTVSLQKVINNASKINDTSVKNAKIVEKRSITLGNKIDKLSKSVDKLAVATEKYMANIFHGMSDLGNSMLLSSSLITGNTTRGIGRSALQAFGGIGAATLHGLKNATTFAFIRRTMTRQKDMLDNGSFDTSSTKNLFKELLKFGIGGGIGGTTKNTLALKSLPLLEHRGSDYRGAFERGSESMSNLLGHGSAFHRKYLNKMGGKYINKAVSSYGIPSGVAKLYGDDNEEIPEADGTPTKPFYVSFAPPSTTKKNKTSVTNKENVFTGNGMAMAVAEGLQISASKRTGLFSTLFDVKGMIGYALPFFGMGYRAEWQKYSSPRNGNVLGSLLSGLGLIYVHNRFASEEANSLMLQFLEMYKLVNADKLNGIEISKPGPRSITEYIGNTIRKHIFDRLGINNDLLTNIFDSGKNVIRNITSKDGGYTEKIKGVFSKFREFFKYTPSGDGDKPTGRPIFSIIADRISGIKQQLSLDNKESFVTKIYDILKDILNKISEFGKNLYNNNKELISKFTDKLSEIFKLPDGVLPGETLGDKTIGWAHRIIGAISKIPSLIASIITKAMNSTLGTLNKDISNDPEINKTIKGKLILAFQAIIPKSIRELMLSAADTITRGLTGVSGILSKSFESVFGMAIDSIYVVLSGFSADSREKFKRNKIERSYGRLGGIKKGWKEASSSFFEVMQITEKMMMTKMKLVQTFVEENAPKRMGYIISRLAEVIKELALIPQALIFGRMDYDLTDINDPEKRRSIIARAFNKASTKYKELRMDEQGNVKNNVFKSIFGSLGSFFIELRDAFLDITSSIAQSIGIDIQKNSSSPLGYKIGVGADETSFLGAIKSFFIDENGKFSIKAAVLAMGNELLEFFTIVRDQIFDFGIRIRDLITGDISKTTWDYVQSNISVNKSYNEYLQKDRERINTAATKDTLQYLLKKLENSDEYNDKDENKRQIIGNIRNILSNYSGAAFIKDLDTLDERETFGANVISHAKKISKKWGELDSLPNNIKNNAKLLTRIKQILLTDDPKYNKLSLKKIVDVANKELTKQSNIQDYDTQQEVSNIWAKFQRASEYGFATGGTVEETGAYNLTKGEEVISLKGKLFMNEKFTMMVDYLKQIVDSIYGKNGKTILSAIALSLGRFGSENGIISRVKYSGNRLKEFIAHPLRSISGNLTTTKEMITNRTNLFKHNVIENVKSSILSDSVKRIRTDRKEIIGFAPNGSPILTKGGPWETYKLIYDIRKILKKGIGGGEGGSGIGGTLGSLASGVLSIVKNLVPGGLPGMATALVGGSMALGLYGTASRDEVPYLSGYEPLSDGTDVQALHKKLIDIQKDKNTSPEMRAKARGMVEKLSPIIESRKSMDSSSYFGAGERSNPTKEQLTNADNEGLKLVNEYKNTFGNDVPVIKKEPKNPIPFPYNVVVGESPDANLNSPFGTRFSGKKGHAGIDIGSGYGTSIYTPFDGTVVRSGFEDPSNKSKGFGYRVAIQSPIGNKNYIVTYGHMIENSSSLRVGDKVRAGTMVGKMGNTGHIITSQAGPTAGTHLHWQFNDIGNSGRPVDPFTSSDIRNQLLENYTNKHQETTSKESVDRTATGGSDTNSRAFKKIGEGLDSLNANITKLMTYVVNNTNNITTTNINLPVNSPNILPVNGRF